MLTLLLALLLSFMDSTQVYYSEKNVEGLQSLWDEAEERVEDLVVRYRLYPLTEDEAYLESIPSDLDDGTARELALLSGLWAYRAAEASIINAIRYGRRSSQLIDEAREKDPFDPFVLLVEGQSLLFRPAAAGRDREAALDRFERLLRVLEREEEDIGIAPIEAEIWRWYALRELERENADDVRNELLATNPPPLYEQFLTDPPE